MSIETACNDRSERLSQAEEKPAKLGTGRYADRGRSGVASVQPGKFCFTPRHSD
jgi:hypothetical protein